MDGIYNRRNYAGICTCKGLTRPLHLERMVDKMTRGYAIVQKLLTLTNPETFWDDVRRMTKNVKSDHTLGIWLAYAEDRYECILPKDGDNQ